MSAFPRDRPAPSGHTLGQTDRPSLKGLIYWKMRARNRSGEVGHGQQGGWAKSQRVKQVAFQSTNQRQMFLLKGLMYIFFNDSRKKISLKLKC